MTAPRVLLLDNYDSFTWNLAQALMVLGAEVVVRRNDEVDLAACDALDPTHVVISPGPGRPEDAGLSIPLIRHVLGRLPVLGVCLGHQALAVALGGEVVHAPRLMHGKASPVRHDGRREYAGVPSPFDAARYHSLIVSEAGLPSALEVSARTDRGEIMGIRHRELPAYGVQFHPESVLCPDGPAILANVLAEGG